ncbi:hypothetical protein B0T21DRAFT_415262 [Apiosordaria backusii]|uniref:Uncharacterized protein n=1 Tax=Apiosordaria backusii TaxID=314023 RepID=A0AA40DU82_9PEZI|nr:hypothetical protein B0T21DRAFT_415262 [Apiosordaria backusii]
MDQSYDSSSPRYPSIRPSILLSSLVWLDHPDPIPPCTPDSPALRSTHPAFHCLSSGRTIHGLANRMRRPTKWRTQNTMTFENEVLLNRGPDQELESQNKRLFREVFGSKKNGTIYTCGDKAVEAQEHNPKRQKLNNTCHNNEHDSRRGDKQQDHQYQEENDLTGTCEPSQHMEQDFCPPNPSPRRDKTPPLATKQDPTNDKSVDTTPSEVTAPNEAINISETIITSQTVISGVASSGTAHEVHSTAGQGASDGGADEDDSNWDQ